MSDHQNDHGHDHDHDHGRGSSRVGVHGVVTRAVLASLRSALYDDRASRNASVAAMSPRLLRAIGRYIGAAARDIRVLALETLAPLLAVADITGETYACTVIGGG